MYDLWVIKWSVVKPVSDYLWQQQYRESPNYDKPSHYKLDWNKNLKHHPYPNSHPNILHYTGTTETLT